MEKKEVEREEEDQDLVDQTWSEVEEVYVITHDIPAFVAAYRLKFKSHLESVSRTKFRMFRGVRTAKTSKRLDFYLQANHTVLYDQTVFHWNT